ncbi:MAG TPA: NAD-dependent epimerase/dehydratase family protein [Terracidiphilus sp.]|jgi:nucleoside-diphosphate-sugar epimerase
MAITTILGAGGSVSNELAKILTASKEPYRLVGRNPRPHAGAEVVAADIADPEQALRAVSGSNVVYLVAGLKYDSNLWRAMWPRIMGNVIEACKQAQAKLIFLDNVYMYGKVSGPMTEETPYSPLSIKGEVRAHIANMLMSEVKSGNLTAMIARAADFYGPDAANGLPNVLVFGAFAQGSTASWLVDDTLPHSLTFVPDVARGLASLAGHESAWGQIWHLPTAAPALTGKQFITLTAKEFAVPPKYRVMKRPILKLVGWFNPLVRESYEMLYQNDSPYLFDSTKFAREFDFAGTPYAEGIRITASAYKSGNKP